MQYVLTLDPSFRHNGWAVVELSAAGTRIIAAGVIVTKKADKKQKAFAGDDNHRCSQEIAEQLSAVIDCYKPVMITAEAQAGSKNSRAAQLMGMNWGVVSAVACLKGVPILQATPTAVKRALTGKKDASKQEIEEVVVARFPELVSLLQATRPKSLHEHAYDAAAVYIACEDSTEIKMIKRML